MKLKKSAKNISQWAYHCLTFVMGTRTGVCSYGEIMNLSNGKCTRGYGFHIFWLAGVESAVAQTSEFRTRSREVKKKTSNWIRWQADVVVRRDA